jgi:hypothetical protein
VEFVYSSNFSEMALRCCDDIDHFRYLSPLGHLKHIQFLTAKNRLYLSSGVPMAGAASTSLRHRCTVTRVYLCPLGPLREVCTSRDFYPQTYRIQRAPSGSVRSLSPILCCALLEPAIGGCQ